MSNKALEPIEFPELVFATVGPIGVDMEGISAVLGECLKAVGYQSEVIKLTAEMRRVPAEIDAAPNRGDDLYHWKMNYANALRRKFQMADVLARIALEAVRSRRRAITGGSRNPAAHQAYLISQLKTPEEVELFRTVYGGQFILIAAYASEQDRRDRLVRKLKTELSTNITDAELLSRAAKLIEIDASEDDQFGQKLRDTFHLGDVFINGLEPSAMKLTLNRFTQALFGR